MKSMAGFSRPRAESAIGRSAHLRYVSAMHTVAVLVFEPVAVFETAVACEVFGLDRQDMGVPRYRFVMCTPEPGALQTKGGGITMVVDRGLGALRQADTIICPSWSFFDEDPPRAALNALVATRRRGARIVSFCSGAFVLAAAGLLDHRRVATHWMHASALAAR